MKKILKTIIRELSGNIIVLMCIVGFGVSSCTYYTNDFDHVEILDSISFELNVIPIFEASCNDAGCHSGAIPPDLQRDVAYNNLIFGGYVTDTTAAENNTLYQKIDGGSMTVYANNQDRANIKKWIEDGAKNN